MRGELPEDVDEGLRIAVGKSNLVAKPLSVNAHDSETASDDVVDVVHGDSVAEIRPTDRRRKVEVQVAGVDARPVERFTNGRRQVRRENARALLAQKVERILLELQCGHVRVQTANRKRQRQRATAGR